MELLRVVKMFYMLIVVIVSLVYACVGTHQIVGFK